MNYKEARTKMNEIEQKLYGTAEPITTEEISLISRVRGHYVNHFDELLEALKRLRNCPSMTLENQDLEDIDAIEQAEDAIRHAEEVEGL